VLVEAHPRRSLSLGLLAMAPLLVAYELALWRDPTAARNTSELILGLGLTPFGGLADPLRRAGLALLFVAALVTVRRRGNALGSGLARCVLEGIAGALVLGPVLIGLSALVSDWIGPLDVDWSRPADSPGLVRAGLIMGGAAWEELFFRVGLYGAVFVVVRAAAQRLGAGVVPAAWTGEVCGLLGSSFVFAAIHLEVASGWLGAGGELFDAALFTWRFLAGVLLALLFRWRGPGVAAWTHALFNLGLELGSGVDVLQ